MKLGNLKIGVQQRLGQAVILFLMVLLGVTALLQVNSLWRDTKVLSEHPLAVRGALERIVSEFLFLRLTTEELVQAQSDREREASTRDIDAREAVVLRQINLLYDRYLGPRKDIDDLREDVIQWKSIHAETAHLLSEGNKSEAAARTRADGPDGQQLKKRMGNVREIGDFAIQKADQIYADAGKHKNILMARLVAMFAAIFLASLGVGFLLLKGVKDPLRELSRAAELYRRGKLDARSRYASKNEFGALSESFNALAEAVQVELRSRDDVSAIAAILFRKEEMRDFCRELLLALLQHTGSQVGAVYLLNERKTAFDHFESIGLSPAGRASFPAAGYEGEFGAALATRRIQHLTDIPRDARFTFNAVTGEFPPREILTIPILSGREVTALVSLAGVRSYSESALRLVKDTWSLLTARMNSLQALRQIRAFAERLELQNRELEEQKKELMMQKDEMSEQNIELELQKKQLDEANRLKTTFLSNMSHELRTPLNSVIALSGVLSRRLAKIIPAEEHSYLEVIERNGRRLLELINDILDLSRIEAGREEISLSRFSVRELVAEVVAIIEPQAREKNIALIDSVDGNLPPIRSDFSKCRHIMQNLVANAVKFTGEGSVEIRAASVGDSVEITVSDTGIGIAADRIPFIFDEFRQGDDSTTRIYGGSGLGLSIARKYAVMLQGAVTVESEPGKGSTFTFRLPESIGSPFTREAAPGAARYSSPKAVEYSNPSPVGELIASPTARQGKRILVVEDNGPAVIQLSDILTGEGYRVQVARNGREALERIAETIPDAMILDLMMPEVDGFEVLRAIRGAETTSRIPVLILTAKHVTREELSFLVGNNIHQLIQKGNIDRVHLLEAIGEMVAPPRAPRRLPPRVSARALLSGKPVVLVVEDNPDNLLTVKALLSDSCSVFEAVDGKAGVEEAQRLAPDCILMDISLPVMDGFQALEAIRNTDALRSTPVIALTASAMKGAREKILAYGFDGYISKPVDKDLLEEMIREMLHGKEDPDDTGH
jgi:signal transduction histidine kinase/DNA-binding response OmpR family regulator/HAMP domain-containing protein